MSTVDEPASPVGTPQLARLIDEAGSLKHFDVERELHTLQTTAIADGNADLASAARCEANVYAIFRDEGTLIRYSDNIAAYLFQNDLSVPSRASSSNAKFTCACAVPACYRHLN